MPPSLLGFTVSGGGTQLSAFEAQLKQSHPLWIFKIRTYEITCVVAGTSAV